MRFPTVDFAAFLVVVFTASWLLRPRPRAWRLFLLGAAAVFILDPVHLAPEDGGRHLTLNLVVVATGMTMAVAAAALLRVAYPVQGDGRSRSGPGGVWGPPLAVTALVAGTVALVGNRYPGRVDQNARWLVVIVGLVLVNQAFALAAHSARHHERATHISRRLVAGAVALDLGALAWFRYVDWFADVWSDVAERVGVRPGGPSTALAALALSFVVLHAISYVVDVGRGGQRPVSLIDAAVHLTFFPKLVAGPITRVPELVPQLSARADPRRVPAAEAFELILRGLVKHVVIAGYLGVQIVEPVLDAPGDFSRFEILTAVVALAVRIHASFSGWTDIAGGVALLLGIRLPVNFDAPYRSASLTEFWHRWHVTLGRWMRDYLYLPLGGDRAGRGRTQLNIAVTMMLAALWHGAGVTFLAWGALHTVALLVERGLGAREVRATAAGARVVRWTLTFAVVCGGWVFFHARDLADALAVFGHLVTGGQPVGASRVTPVVVLVIGAALGAQFVPPEVPRRIFVRLTAAPPVVQAAAGAAALVLIAALGSGAVTPFIYARS